MSSDSRGIAIFLLGNSPPQITKQPLKTRSRRFPSQR